MKLATRDEDGPQGRSWPPWVKLAPMGEVGPMVKLTHKDAVDPHG
jgi:hypothetical protein